ncbi:Probable LRR receptor-like serine/threonine-protein kinase At1g06840 [Linum grandiflorum]
MKRRQSLFPPFGPLVLLFIATIFSFPLLGSGQLLHPLEVTALNAIRASLNDPQNFLRNWQGIDPCALNWTGVICSPSADDGYLHVHELRLMNMSLTGTLASQLGHLNYTVYLNFMWNNISGSIPKEIGNMNYLKILMVSGNQISGPLPDELGFLPNLTKFQLDLNQISGPIPKTFGNLPKVQHFHMNNNSFSGQLPSELYNLSQLVHLLLDNNKLSGSLPPELSRMPKLKIMQLNNNNFSGTQIPDSYANMSKLLKLSLRNCNLEGPVPDLSSIPRLFYLDLSSNKLSGSIPTNKLADSITTIDLSNNQLNGSIPSSFSGLPVLQRLSLENNKLNGSVPSNIWQNENFSSEAKLTLDFRNNSLSDISTLVAPPLNVSIRLQGNPICTRTDVAMNMDQFCGAATASIVDVEPPKISNGSVALEGCKPQSCPSSGGYEYFPASLISCHCVAPLGVGMRLRSPSMLDFRPYRDYFNRYMTGNLSVASRQLVVDSFIWEEGPRLRMFLKIFPPHNHTEFNTSETVRVQNMFFNFEIVGDDTFGPYDLLNFTLRGNAVIFNPSSKGGGGTKGSKVGIILGAISCVIAVAVGVVVVCRCKRSRRRQTQVQAGRKPTPKIGLKIEGVKEFGFEELDKATNGFTGNTQIGQGGYGKVYKGVLGEGTLVAIKRARQGSLTSEKEFYTEIELLSRVHHRNLVSLLGYCDESGEQMLVYEYMPNGSVQDLLSGRYEKAVTLGTRVNIALGAAKGILYLHAEADPPIIHRDIKANNILLDSKLTPKVSDFGISRLVPKTTTSSSLNDTNDDGRYELYGEGSSSAPISTAVKGTPGYVDPEYFRSHKLTEKSDVYSLGIVLLELVTGMQPISHGKNIVREVSLAWETRMVEAVVDPTLQQGPPPSYPKGPTHKFMGLGLRCCHDEAKARPTMAEVVRELEDLCSSIEATAGELAGAPTGERWRSYGAMEMQRSGNSSSSTGGGSVKASSSSGGDTLTFMSSSAGHGFKGSDLVSGVIPTIRPR